MAAVKMVAKKAFKFGKQMLNPGDEFFCGLKESRIIEAGKKAKKAPDQVGVPKEVPKNSVLKPEPLVPAPPVLVDDAEEPEEVVVPAAGSAPEAPVVEPVQEALPEPVAVEVVVEVIPEALPELAVGITPDEDAEEHKVTSHTVTDETPLQAAPSGQRNGPGQGGNRGRNRGRSFRG